MKTSLKILLCLTGSALSSTTFAAAINSADSFSAEYLMNSALDVAQDSGMEQVNFSRNAGIKKAQEYLHGITKDTRIMLRNIEKNANGVTNIDATTLGGWVATWGQAERIQVRVSGLDIIATSDMDSNTSFNLLFKFAKEHHVHQLDDISIRFVPQISRTEDGEYSIQGWYCETDIDWVDFTKNFVEPADADGSASVGQAVRGQRSMVTRDLAYPLSSCVVAKQAMNLSEVGGSGLGFQVGIVDGEIDTDEIED